MLEDRTILNATKYFLLESQDMSHIMEPYPSTIFRKDPWLCVTPKAESSLCTAHPSHIGAICYSAFPWPKAVSGQRDSLAG